MPLSDAKIRSLKSAERDFKVADFDGLYVLVKSNGKKSWRFKYRIGGKEKLLVIGSYPDVGLKDAREARDAARANLAKGIDPGAAKQQAKLSTAAELRETFAAFARDYLEKIRLEGKAPATLEKAQWLLAEPIADFGAMPLREISAPRVLETLRKFEARGNFESAKRVRAKVSAVFRMAVAAGAADNDPTFALRDALVRPKAKPRAAITDPTALGALLQAIDTYAGQVTTRVALQLMALLAQRPGELRQAKWDEIDLAKAIWTLPPERMKMRRPHQVPLAQQAIERLTFLKELTGHTAYLFPALNTNLRPISENTLNVALRRMGFSRDEMTSHGFRATFATLANESGLWHPDAIERALAHVDGNAIRKVYARGEFWEERVRLAAWWADYLDSLRESLGRLPK